MNKPKLVILDLDQTLLDSPTKQLPSLKFINTVQQIRDDIIVGCATGRSYSWSLPVLQSAHFTAPCILGGGSMIVNPYTYQITESFYLPNYQLNKIKSILSKYPETKILFNDYKAEDYENGGWELNRLLKSETCLLMDIIGLSHERANELIDNFNELDDVRAVKMNGYSIDGVDVLVAHKEASKTKAIERIQTQNGIERTETIGIGNGYNDLQIFDAVGTKVAVDNAVQELKDEADIIIGDVNTDPIPKYLLSI